MTKKRDANQGTKRGNREQDEGQTTRGGAASQRGQQDGKRSEPGERK